MEPIDKARFDENDAGRIVQDLCFPRLVGTPGSGEGVEYCVKKFKDIDVELEKERFLCNNFWISTIVQIGFSLAILLTTLMILLSIWEPGYNLAVLAVVAVMALYALAKMGGGDLPLIGKTFETDNLFGKIPAAKESRGKLLIMAHHDTKSQTLTTIQRTVCFTLAAVGLLFIIVGFLIQAVLTVFSRPVGSFFPILGYVGAGLLFIFGVPLILNATRNESQGALDNASGIAVLYMITKYLKEEGQPFDHLDFWVVITGAEECGMMGAREFLKKHKDELEPETTWLLNFDMVGRVGNTVEYMRTAGFPIRREVSSILSNHIKYAAQYHKVPFKSFYLPIGAATDRYIFTDYGINGIDFINKEASFHTHSCDDLYDTFDPNLAKQFAIVGTQVLYRIAADHDELTEERQHSENA